MRSLITTALDVRWPLSPLRLPPSFLLPWRAQMHQNTLSTQFQNTRPEIPPQLYQPKSPPLQTSATTDTRLETTTTTTRNPPTPFSPPSSPQTSARPLILSKSLQQLLPLLTTQKPHYITAHIHRFPYLLTEGDVLRLPFHMHGVRPGDILRLNRASILGSRDYTLKAGKDSCTADFYDGKKTTAGSPNYVDERLFECRARVVGLDSGPLVVEIKTKRRQRKKKHVRSKHRYTVLRVMQLKVKGLEELRRASDQLILE